MSLKNLEVKIGANTTGFDRGMRKVSSGVKSVTSGFSALAKSAMALGGIAAGIAGITQAMKSFVSLESDVKRTTDIFKDSAKYLEYFAQNTAKSFGMAESSVYQYAATYGNLFKNITSSTIENATVTVAMLKASAVIASKTGRTMEDVMDRIRSGLLGNTEAIEDLGINVNVAMLESTDAFKKMADGRSWEKLSFYEQQQIRTLAILEQSHKNFGDTVQTGSAFSLSVLSGAIKDLISTAGAFINSALQPIVKWLTSIVQAATGALKSLAAMLGINIKVDTGAVGDIADNEQSLADSTEEANEALKKQKNLLSSIDELNVLNPGDDSTAATPGLVKSPFANIPLPEFKIESKSFEIDSSGIKKVVDKVKGYLAPLNNISFDNLKNAFEKLKDAIEPLSKKIFEGLDWAYQNLFVPLAEWYVEDYLPVWIDNLSATLKVLNSLIEALKPLGVWLWEEFLQPLATWTGGALIDTLKWLTNALKGVSDWIDNNQQLVRKIAEIVLAFAAAWVAVNAALNIYNGLKSAVVATTAAIGAGVSTTTLAMTKVGLVLIWVASQWETLTYWAETNAERMTNAAKKTADYFQNNWKDSILGSIGQTLRGLTDLVTGVFTGDWQKAWSGIENITRGVANIIIDIINAIIDVINLIPGVDIPKMDRLNDNNYYSYSGNDKRSATSGERGGSVREGNTSSGSTYSGSTGSNGKSGFQEAFATGVVVTKPVVAKIGEKGKEVVMPLENNTGWIDELASRIAFRNNAVPVTAGGATDVYVYLGNEELDNYIVKSVRNHNARTNGRG